jgi:hypothetical protein
MQNNNIISNRANNKVITFGGMGILQDKLKKISPFWEYVTMITFSEEDET